MGTYKEIEGDLIVLAKAGKFDIIGHGCNCFATMQAGIAKPIKEAFPEAYKADQNWKATPEKRLGSFTVGENIKYGVMVVNFYTQFMPGPDLRIKALESSFREFATVMKETLSEDDIEAINIGLPLIGCGIAGGDWKEVSKLIRKELKDFNVTIVKLPSNVKKFPLPIRNFVQR